MKGLIEKIERRLLDNPDPTPAELARLVREEAGVISDQEVLNVLRCLRDNTAGAGKLERLLELPGITDIVVNSPRDIFFDRGSGLQRAELSFSSTAEIRTLATRLAASCGRRLDDAQPFADGRFTRPDGTAVRLHAILSPPACNSPMLSLRVLRQAKTGLDDLVASGTFSADVASLLRTIVATRKSVLIVGGTGSGKTTLLSALLTEVSASERIVCIEDTPELNPAHPHVVSLVTRGANAEGVGVITMSDLLAQALRMRPDRVVVGEIRGKEVVDLLAALNTGHEGGAGTLHANTAEEVPARMEALGALGGLDRLALHSQLAAGVDVVLVMAKNKEGRRRLRQIATLEANPVEVTTVWQEGEAVSSRHHELFQQRMTSCLG